MADVRIAAVVFLISCIVFGLIGGEEKFASGYGIARAGLGAAIISLRYLPAVKRYLLAFKNYLGL